MSNYIFFFYKNISPGKILLKLISHISFCSHFNLIQCGIKCFFLCHFLSSYLVYFSHATFKSFKLWKNYINFSWFRTRTAKISCKDGWERRESECDKSYPKSLCIVRPIKISRWQNIKIWIFLISEGEKTQTSRFNI